MKCPLFRLVRITEHISAAWGGDDCNQADCAWWNNDHEVCSMKVIAKELTNQTLKMPHAGQFAK